MGGNRYRKPLTLQKNDFIFGGKGMVCIDSFSRSIAGKSHILFPFVFEIFAE
jgi:hypothetical protein